jgi:hypothetical protein
MKITYLTRSSQRSTGAMRRLGLGEEILVFVYPVLASRLFHTFLCKPLRIVGIGKEGRVVYDQVATSNRIVFIPACYFVLEMDPEVEYSSQLQGILVNSPFRARLSGGWESNIKVDALLFALVNESIANIGLMSSDNDVGTSHDPLYELVTDVLSDISNSHNKRKHTPRVVEVQRHFSDWEQRRERASTLDLLLGVDGL